jgi:hypothetical protein
VGANDFHPGRETPDSTGTILLPRAHAADIFVPHDPIP